MIDKEPVSAAPWRRVVRPTVVVLTSLILGYLLQSALRIVLWRSHWQPGIDAMRKFNKRFNFSASRTAGKKGSGTTAVHHVGRKSGRPYVTPVWAERVGETFFIQLPYGTDVDWCRNVLAAGRCTLEQNGVRYDAVAPLIVPAAEARPHLPPAARRMQRLVGAESYLRVDISPGVTAS